MDNGQNQMIHFKMIYAGILFNLLWVIFIPSVVATTGKVVTFFKFGSRPNGYFHFGLIRVIKLKTLNCNKLSLY